MLIVTAAAQVPIELQDGSELLQACVDDPTCGTEVATLVSESLLRIGFALQHHPIATSALGGKGMGPVVEVGLGTAALEGGNELDEAIHAPFAVPRIAVGWQVGSYTYDDPYPQHAVGAWLTPPITVSAVRGFGLGLGGSSAWPVAPALWVGGEVDWAYATVDAPFVGEGAAIGSLDAAAGKLADELVCDEPCTDRLTTQAFALRAGASVEPIPALFAWGRVGVAVVAQTLVVSIDGSRWRQVAPEPQLGTGVGVRAGDRWQLGVGVEAAGKPGRATTTAPWMAKVMASTSFRFGAPRYWSAAPGQNDEKNAAR